MAKARATVLSLLCAWTMVHAEPPTARYTGAQLDLAESQLEDARVALQGHDYSLARQLAAQASLDARLAWAMSDSQLLRRDALELARMADRVRAQGLLSAGGGRGAP